jgi:hypothetical protein
VQIAIWTRAWFRRLQYFWEDNPRLQLDIEGRSGGMRPPAVPLLIVQGHDWHALVVVKLPDGTMQIWEKISIGSTRNIFDAYKALAALHWLMQWANDVWKPWFLDLVIPTPLPP